MQEKTDFLKEVALGGESPCRLWCPAWSSGAGGLEGTLHSRVSDCLVWKFTFFMLCVGVKFFLYYWWLDFNLKIFFGILLKCFDFMIVKLVFSVLPIDIICL